MKPFGHSLFIDKPLDWTSFDVVNKIRYGARDIIGVKKVKVGHAGTLDPLASGLVIICVGSHTKIIEGFMGLDKTYSGSFVLGASRPSYDMETEIDHRFELPPNELTLLNDMAQSMTGDMDQIPPIYSAKKIGGRKAYELARKGKDVELKSSRVHIESFVIDNSRFPEIGFEVKCSKGTYIRSLAHDFGKNLGSGAYLSSLRRVAIGPHNIDEAQSIEEGIEELRRSYSIYQTEHSE